MPPSRNFTISGLDSLFRANHEVIFLQRWFGGESLRRKFVERRMNAYNQGIQNHDRIRFLKEMRCGLGGDPAETPVKPAPRSRPHMLYRGWG
jgi:hypothetical protein